MDETTLMTEENPNYGPSEFRSRHDGRGWDREYKRRVAVLYIDEREVLDCVRTALTDSAPPKYRLRLNADGIPRDCDVISVKTCWDRSCFGFMLFHESFAPVPEGCPAPDLSTKTRWEWVPVEPIVVKLPTEAEKETRELMEKFSSGAFVVMPKAIPNMCYPAWDGNLPSPGEATDRGPAPANESSNPTTTSPDGEPLYVEKK